MRMIAIVCTAVQRRLDMLRDYIRTLEYDYSRVNSEALELKEALKRAQPRVSEAQLYGSVEIARSLTPVATSKEILPYGEAVARLRQLQANLPLIRRTLEQLYIDLHEYENRLAQISYMTHPLDVIAALKELRDVIDAKYSRQIFMSRRRRGL
jgi:hypothetical protein